MPTPPYPQSPPPPIMIYGQPCLRGISQAILPDYPLDVLQAQIDTLFAVLGPTNASSLSAPQIGLMLRLFVVNDGSYFINPVITDYRNDDGTPQLCPDGCISIPGFPGTTRRYKQLTMQYQLIENGALATKTTDFNDLRMAYVIQHEVDHLNGILFIDHLSNTDSQTGQQAYNSLGFAFGLSNLNNTALQAYVDGNYSAAYNTLPVTQA